MFNPQSPTDPSSSLQPPPRQRRQALGFAVVALIVVYILWNTASLSGVLYPFRLFVTYVHEAGHSIMAVATGGEIVGFQVSSDGSGLATTRGGSRALILPAGYLGAAAFGAILFYLVNTGRYTRSYSIILGVMLILFSLFYARPDSSGIPLALFVGSIFGAVLIGIGWKASRSINLLLLNILAIITSLNAVFDLFYLVNNTSITADGSSGPIRNDVAAFSAEITPIIPPVVWAIIWAGLALMMIGISIYLSIVRPMRHGTL